MCSASVHELIFARQRKAQVKRKPKNVSASRKEEVLRIEWEDGQTSEIPFGTLRAAC
ncbi:MAG: DUF971 domain-containing protein, partial [Anaerolineales bacterium]|nr:DUF971 domain-containing protein [Anaerolineales bacterium]